MNAEIQMRDAARADLAAAVEAHLAAGGTIQRLLPHGPAECQAAQLDIFNDCEEPAHEQL